MHMIALSHKRASSMQMKEEQYDSFWTETGLSES